MRAGLLKHRITLLTQAAGRDDAGQPVGEWGVLRKTWANILFNSGRETIRTEKWNWQPQASCRIRKQSVSPDMRVLFNDDVYEITAMIPQDDFIDLIIQRVSSDE